MKKICALLLTAASVFALASCNNEEDTTASRLSAASSEIGETWGLDLSNDFETLYSPEDKSQSYYQVQMPKDATNSLRLVDINLTEYKDEYESYNLNYLSTYGVTETYQSYALTAVNDNKDTINNKLEGIGSNSKINSSWEFEAAYKDEVSALSNPLLSVLYMPIVLSYTEVDGDSQDTILNAYVFVPVYYAVCEKTSGTYSNDIINSYKDKTITFTMDGSVVA